MQKTYNTLVAGCALTLLFAALPVPAQPVGERVEAEVTYKNDQREKATISTKSFSVNTRFGKLGFNTGEILSVRLGENSYEWIMETVHQDRWQIVIPFELLWQLPGTNTLDITQVAYSNLTESKEKQHGTFLLSLVDGSTVNASSESLTWTVQQGTRSTRISPMNFSRVSLESDGKETRIEAHYPSGPVLRGRLMEDKPVVEDLFGNRLQLAWKDIESFQPQNNFPEPTPIKADQSDELIRMRVRARKEVLDFDSPPSHFILSDDLGEHLLPLAFIQGIEPASRSGVFGLVGPGRFEVQTIWGDRWKGKLRPDRLVINDPDGGPEQEIRLRDTRSVRVKVMELERPSNTATIYLKGRMPFYAVLPPRIANLRQTLNPGETSELVSITPEADKLWRIRLQNRTIMAKATGTSLNLLVLATGTPLEVPWSRIERIDFKTIPVEGATEDWGKQPDPARVVRLPEAPGGKVLPADPPETTLRPPGAVDETGGREIPLPPVPPKRTDQDTNPPIFPRSPTVKPKLEPGPGPEPEPPVLPSLPRLQQDPGVRLEGGWFEMGRGKGEGMDDEVPRHRVFVSPFIIDPHEVTREAFAEFVAESGYRSGQEEAGKDLTWSKPGFIQADDHPVVWVTWLDAVAYCNWRSGQEDLDPCYIIDRRAAEAHCDFEADGYRLPTEAEWEFAASSGGKNITFPWGDEAVAAIKQANFKQPRGSTEDGWHWTSPVQAQPANALGIYGLAGNAWEWCQDWYHPQAYRIIHPVKQTDPCVELDDAPRLTTRVMRGGSFQNDLDFMRVASRGSGKPTASANRIGFRCVRKANSE